MAQFAPNFSSIDEMWRHYALQGIRPHRYGRWHLSNVEAGSVRALDVQGLLVATDGHQAIVDLCNGKCFICLLKNFIPRRDAKERVEKVEINIFANFQYE